MKKRILLAIDNMKIGGIQKNMLNLLIELHDKFDLTLCVFNAVGKYMQEIPESVKVIQLDSAFHLLGMSNAEAKSKLFLWLKRMHYYIIMRLFGNRRLYKCMLKTQKHLGQYDYAISGMQTAVAGVFFSGCNELILEKVDAKEKIAYIHCDFVQSGIDNPYNRSIYRRLDKILVPNRSNYEQLISVMPDLKDKVFIVNNFCNYVEIEEKSKIETVEYDKEKINVLTVARISEEKGLDRAINVFDCLKKEGFSFSYHIVGGGKDYEKLCTYVQGNGLVNDVYLHGYDDNPYKYLKNADLFLLPSRHEAAGLVIDEARSLNVPVLSTKTVAAEETLQLHNCGWICENSEEGIYKGLKRLLSCPQLLQEKKVKLQSQECNNNIPVEQFMNMLNGEKQKRRRL